jgi:hypothetical protein
MTGSVARALGPSSRYTVLAANVAKTLNALQAREVSEAEKRLLERAAELLSNIVQGSQFVERKDAHALSNPSENLFTVRHALAALSSLGKTGEYAEEITNTFEELEADLRRLTQGERLPKDSLESMRMFFDALCSFFYRDVADSAAPARYALFDKPFKA